MDGGLDYMDYETNTIVNISEKDGYYGANTKGIQYVMDSINIAGTNAGLGYFELIDRSVHV